METDDCKSVTVRTEATEERSSQEKRSGGAFIQREIFIFPLLRFSCELRPRRCLSGST